MMIRTLLNQVLTFLAASGLAAACAAGEDQCLELALCQLQVLELCEASSGALETCFTNSVGPACAQLDLACAESR